ncbi:MerR family transcriptional regulator [Acanthopleuribacter pedis]|uniref:MerR family transcriptional regulator n=1 Tax=Acanthopleuribacter pedis TaxID=442870 RepID=A0A8J7U4A8_9BACT|nr:MerR family transcriptional regulator [Acanthopleuribacter pedis]MBO1319228.1 MerR family transcriptional regulator [Acanthopleuribacter pedis]
MNQSLYPMRAVCKLTNLTADTVRAWERRYGAITPGRVKGGRLYSQHDITRLKLLKRVVDAGHRIGSVANLTNPQLQDILKEFRQFRDPGSVRTVNAKVDQIVKACKDYQYLEVDLELEKQASLTSTRRFLSEIVVPLCERVEEEWSMGTVTMGQKHMLFVLIRNLLGTLIRLRGNRAEPGSVMLFSTPMQGTYEFGALITAAIAGEEGYYGLYLGPNLPDSEILMAAKRTGVAGVCLWLSEGSGREPRMAEQMKAIRDQLPKNCKLIVGGPVEKQIAESMEAYGIAVTPGYEAFDDYLSQKARLSK